MGLKHYVVKKIAGKVAEAAFFTAVEKGMEYTDKKNDKKALRNQPRTAKSNTSNVNITDLDTFLASRDKKEKGKEIPPVPNTTIHTLTMYDKTMSFRKTYNVVDKYGNVVYIAKKEGFGSTPSLVIYDTNNTLVGSAKKNQTENPMYTIYQQNQKIGSMNQLVSLKTKFHIPELNWSINGSRTQITIYDEYNLVIGQVQIKPLAPISIIVDYIEPQKEIPVLLIASAIVIGYFLN